MSEFLKHLPSPISFYLYYRCSTCTETVQHRTGWKEQGSAGLAHAAASAMEMGRAVLSSQCSHCWCEECRERKKYPQLSGKREVFQEEVNCTEKM